jgi:hypothetical protein
LIQHGICICVSTFTHSLSLLLTKGWTGDNCDMDVDECLNNDHLCDEKGNSTCNNTIGSYSCVCNTGFNDVGSNKCEGMLQKSVCDELWCSHTQKMRRDIMQCHCKDTSIHKLLWNSKFIFWCISYYFLFTVVVYSYTDNTKKCQPFLLSHFQRTFLKLAL